MDQKCRRRNSRYCGSCRSGGNCRHGKKPPRGRWPKKTSKQQDNEQNATGKANFSYNLRETGLLTIRALWKHAPRMGRKQTAREIFDDETARHITTGLGEQSLRELACHARAASQCDSTAESVPAVAEATSGRLARSRNNYAACAVEIEQRKDFFARQAAAWRRDRRR